jgi:hypothetical protein
MIAWVIRIAILAIFFAILSPFKNKPKRWLRLPLYIIILIGVIVQANWSNLINGIMPANIRPEKIKYRIEKVDEKQFEALAQALVSQKDKIDAQADPLRLRLASSEKSSGLKHVDYFREAGIRSYEGPKTCQQCHSSIKIVDADRKTRKVNLRDDLTHSVHFNFAAQKGFSTYGYNGEKVNNFPMGKIDRACGITGTFTWTGWAELIPSAKGDTLSEGCGQCHIVGQYGPISGAMMPYYSAVDAEWEAVDCLVCHASEYDMNLRQVVRDPNGKKRWEHDRRLIAAMSVGLPGDEECLRCHQHNMGGDTYPGNLAAKADGHEHPRVLHPGAKRGTPFSPEWDVHSAAGLECLDCHVARGHKIARGKFGVDLVANDLPDEEVSCIKCHSTEAHKKGTYADVYNSHTEKIACETCHLKQLYADNLIFRDWTKPSFHENIGIWKPTDAPYNGEPGQGIIYKWFNGNGTFMANALGDNPSGGSYTALDLSGNPLWEPFKAYDYKGTYEKTFRPIARMGQNKIWPFKRFQAVMYEDLNNQGPWGGMILPFDYYTYYTTGDPLASVKVATSSPIIKMMYGRMFKYYMMDKFMYYMGISEWNMNFDINKIAASPMRNEGNLMINHGIQKTGRQCTECHSPTGILDFDKLGYSAERAKELREMGI